MLLGDASPACHAAAASPSVWHWIDFAPSLLALGCLAAAATGAAATLVCPQRVVRAPYALYTIASHVCKAASLSVWRMAPTQAHAAIAYAHDAAHNARAYACDVWRMAPTSTHDVATAAYDNIAAALTHAATCCMHAGRRIPTTVVFACVAAMLLAALATTPRVSAWCSMADAGDAEDTQLSQPDTVARHAIRLQIDGGSNTNIFRDQQVREVGVFKRAIMSIRGVGSAADLGIQQTADVSLTFDAS